MRESANSRVRTKICVAAVSNARSTKRLSVQESTESLVRRGLFRDPETDDRPPDIGIQLLQASFLVQPRLEVTTKVITVFGWNGPF